MKQNEELLQRCFDGDLNDDEMKQLFFAMSNDKILRKQFRSFQTLRLGLQSIPLQNVPVKLDERIKSLHSVSRDGILPSKSALRRVFTKRFTLSVPAFAATVLLLLAGSYFAATNIFVQQPKKEYVYVLQIPEIEIRDVFLQ